ncbi:Spore germination protein YaaH [Paenibacillus sp. UNCCL117]|uniref:glycosyl hydrolase family 18 protein n=1 Tax=unclassified Paenibacillus TaxID=185978 RepID=UPI000888F262|nr:MULTISPECIES: glycosyl hydrolase family 18 protein [unclassified Paenibacillus]SDC45057.1 Spore germination protein YaaH [Paenibacillus sp. cl123]SFW12603.1 Spore germination protein YaaH [Paenibacillus sp. UNCCL117]
MLKRKTLLSLTALSLLFSVAGTAAAADKTTKYRVYQDTTLLYEAQDYKSAEAYARRFADSHVEEIGSRNWVWHNYPRYKVYQHGYSSSSWEYATLEQAIREASNWGSASVRDLQSGGWVWNNYPEYQVYQGEGTMPSWSFRTLNEAILEAKKWSNSHIIELDSHAWVWDNISAAAKAEARSQSPKVYQVYQGTHTSDSWKFGLLEDAVQESLRWGNSTVVNTNSGQVVFSNLKPFKVYQNSTYLNDFLSLDDAIAYAKQFAHTRIENEQAPKVNGKAQIIWNNYPFYQVYQSSNLIGEFTTIGSALQYAKGYSNASIRLYDDGSAIWDNLRKLQYWGWNGSSADATIRSQVNTTRGLDVVSPTYFTLADASGNLTDTSNKDTVSWLKSQGMAVHPLVNNQFDAALTTKFLASKDARAKFIAALVDKSAALGVHGINVDFESLAASDRANFTTFMQELVNAAHAKNLLVSVDLPRGSVKWNAKTAFDHEKLATIADYIMTMTYDQYWKGSTEPGSVAGLQWVEEGVKEFLSYGIPRDKLIMGIPFYVREWKVDGSGNLVSNRAVLMKDIPKLIQDKKATQTWDPAFQQYKVEYKEGGFTYVFWKEDEATVKARIDIAAKHELAGVAAWRLGYDTTELWNMMLQQK